MSYVGFKFGKDIQKTKISLKFRSKIFRSVQKNEVGPSITLGIMHRISSAIFGNACRRQNDFNVLSLQCFEAAISRQCFPSCINLARTTQKHN